MTLFDRALKFAIDAHGTQTRKYTNTPYVIHPIRVAEILYDVVNAPDYVLAAALNHDVLEDTHIIEPQMRDELGDDVTDLVVEVTDISKPSDGNRAKRKAIDRMHLSNASFWGQSIKLADMIHNRQDIFEHDHGFAKVYNREMVALFNDMRGGHYLLRRMFQQQLPIILDLTRPETWQFTADAVGIPYKKIEQMANNFFTKLSWLDP